MREYRLIVFEGAAEGGARLDFEAQTDRDAVELGQAAAAGLGGALWREGRLLLRLDGAGQPPPDLSAPA